MNSNKPYHIRFLNCGSIGHWVAEWHPKFDNICPALLHGEHDCNSIVICRIARCYESNKNSFTLLIVEF